MIIGKVRANLDVMLRKVWLRLKSMVIASIVAAFASAASFDTKGQGTNSGPKDLRSDYIVDSWQTEQGLPDNFVTSLAQSPDGYLWVGTFSGLARFNGTEFAAFDAGNTPELPDSRIVDLKVDGGGRLWVRSLSGRLTVWRDGHFRLFPKTNPPAIESPAVTLDAKGNLVWSRKLEDLDYFVFDGNDFKAARGGTNVYHLTGLQRDAEGFGWGVEGGRLFSLNPHKPGEWAIPGFVDRMGWRLGGARDGGIWFVGGSGIKKFREGGWVDYGSLPIVTDMFDGFTEDHLGHFWLGVGVGEIWRANTDRTITRFKLTDTAITQPGRLIIEDAEQNLWIGTGGRGVMRLRPRIVKTFDSRSGLASDVVRSVSATADGKIWLATVNSVDCLDSAIGKALKRHPEIELPWRVYSGRDGALWVGTFSEGLFKFANGESVRLRAPRGISNPPILKLLETRSGDLYVGTQRGLFKVGEFELEICAPKEETKTLDVRAIEEGLNGEIYIGLNGDGLLRKSGDKWETFTGQNGLASDYVTALHVDRDGAVWIGTEGKGLSRLKNGRIFNFPETIRLPRKIIGIVEDDEGRFWFASNRGLFCANRDGLRAIAEGQAASASLSHYDRSDGMGSSECTGEAAKSADGRLWFSTMFGVTVIDPKALPRNARPPPVVIEQIVLDDKPVPNRPNETFTIPKGLHRLEVRFAGLSFTAPERVRYKYKLQGYDENWVDAGNRRAAYYTGIEPGSYEFRVRAANNDGFWNDRGAALAVVALPYFWQRRPVQVAGILFLAGLAVMIARYWTLIRVRQRMAELERRHALDKERGRISRDLHDSLGADLSQLALWSDLALQEADRPGLMAQRARDVSQLTREVIQNVEEIVWTVNPKNDSLEKFAAYLCEFSERIVARAGLRFRWEAPVEIPVIPIASDTRHNLFLVTKEALNNLVKHSVASEARVKLALDAGVLEINISDNGRGCDFEKCASNGGNGLSNMRERIAACSGETTFESRKGQGSSIIFRIPLGKHCDK